MSVFSRVGFLYKTSNIKGKNFIYISIVTGLLLCLLHAIFSIDTYDDLAVYYGPMAKAFRDGDYKNALLLDVPVLQSILGGIVSMSGLNVFSSMILVSGLFYVLTTFPLYYIILYIFKDEKLAGLGSLMFILAPKIIRFSNSGLLTGGRNFFITAAIALILIPTLHKKKIYSLLLGIVFAGLALIRGEGILFIPPLILFSIYTLWKTCNKDTDVKKKLWFVFSKTALALIIFLLLISPRLIQTQKATSYPLCDGRQKMMFVKLRRIFKPDKTVPAANANTNNNEARTISYGLDCFIRGSYEPYLILAVLGLVLLILRKRFSYDMAFLLAVSLYNLMIFSFVIHAYRYYLINVVLFMPFAVYGLAEIIIAIKAKFKFRYVNLLLAVIFAVIIIEQIINGTRKLISSEYRYEYNVGKWLKKQAEKVDRKIVIFALPDSPFAFWADGEAVNVGSKAVFDNSNFSLEFDYAVFPSKEKEIINRLMKQKNLRQVNFNDKNVVILEKVNKDMKRKNHDEDSDASSVI